MEGPAQPASAASRAIRSSSSRPETSPSSFAARAAFRPRPTAGPSGTPGLDQVVAVDLELDVAQAVDVVVEPVRARRREPSRAPRGRGRGRGPGSRRESRARRGGRASRSAAAQPRRVVAGRDREQDRGVAVGELAHPGSGSKRRSMAAASRGPVPRSSTPHSSISSSAALGRSSPAMRASSAATRSSETVARSASRSSARCPDPASSRTARRSGPPAARGSGRRGRSRSCRTRSTPGAQVVDAAVGVDQLRLARRAATAIALTVKSRRARSSAMRRRADLGQGARAARRSRRGRARCRSRGRRPRRSRSRSARARSAPRPSASASGPHVPLDHDVQVGRARRRAAGRAPRRRPGRRASRRPRGAALDAGQARRGARAAAEASMWVRAAICSGLTYHVPLALRRRRRWH